MSLFFPKDGDQPMLALGPIVRKPAATTPLGTDVATGAPGIYEAPNGKLFTRIPENERAQSGCVCHASVSILKGTDTGRMPIGWKFDKPRHVGIGDTFHLGELLDYQIELLRNAAFDYDRMTRVYTRIA